MTNFTIDIAGIEEQIAYGSGSIQSEVKVTGFWGAPVTIRVKRDWSFRDEKNVTWNFEISHSSGGTERDTDSLVTERYFAEAIVAACDYVETLKPRAAELEAAYQRRMAEWKATAEAERAAKQAKIDADKAIGEKAARAYLDALVANTRASDPRIRVLRAKVRGEDDIHDFVAIRNWSDRVTLRLHGSAIGTKAAAEKLAGYAFAGLVTDAKLDENELIKLQREYL